MYPVTEKLCSPDLRRREGNMSTSEALFQGKRPPSLTPLESDENHIAACLSGDNQAWEALIAKYSRLIYSIPFRYGLSDTDAADVFQSVCLKLLENLHSLRDCTKLSSWLITTTTRECWSVAKKRARLSQKDFDSTEEGFDQLDLSPLPEEVTLMLEEHQEVREAFRRLPHRDQQLLWYLFYDKSGLSYADIGRRLGIPEGSVGPLRARSLERLRLLLQEADWT